MVTPEQYHNLFIQSPNGSDVLEDLKKAHHYYDSSFDPSPFETARNEGERNVVLRILTILKQHEEEKNA